MKNIFPGLTLSLALAASSAQAASPMTSQAPRRFIDLTPNNVSLSTSFNAKERQFTLQGNFYGDHSTVTRPCSSLDGLVSQLTEKNAENLFVQFVAGEAKEDLEKLIQANPTSLVTGSVDEASNHYAELMLTVTKQAIANCAKPDGP